MSGSLIFCLLSGYCYYSFLESTLNFVVKQPLASVILELVNVIRSRAHVLPFLSPKYTDSIFYILYSFFQVPEYIKSHL